MAEDEEFKTMRSENEQWNYNQEQMLKHERQFKTAEWWSGYKQGLNDGYAKAIDRIREASRAKDRQGS